MSLPAAHRWEPIVRRARRSGLSMRAYAREHGLNGSTLAWWNWRIGAGLDEPTFVEVTVAHPEPRVRLQLGPVVVDVDQHTDLALLRQVVEALS